MRELALSREPVAHRHYRARQKSSLTDKYSTAITQGA
jgi:hypothetical protein